MPVGLYKCQYIQMVGCTDVHLYKPTSDRVRRAVLALRRCLRTLGLRAGAGIKKGLV